MISEGTHMRLDLARKLRDEPPRLFAATRQATGDPMRHYAYVMDRQTGKPIATCQHRHVSRLRHGGKNGEFYAMRCAEKMLRKMEG